MRGSKDTSRAQKERSNVPAGKAAKKKQVKVVDVKLSGKGLAKETKRVVATRGAKTGSAKAVSAKTQPVKKASTKELAKPLKAKATAEAPPPPAAPSGLAKEVMKEKTSPVRKVGLLAKKKPALARVVAPPPPPAPILAPTPELLKPFRAAAKKNRLSAKEQEKSRASRANFLAKPLKKGKKYVIDLRVHTPGTVGYFAAGGIEPGPALVRLAQVKGLDILGLTDYYNASLIDAVLPAAQKAGLSILPGLDLCCSVAGCREVYVVTLFPENTPSTALFAVLDALGVPKQAYGRKDYVLDRPFAEVLEIVESRGGVVIPSRIDKTPYRQLAIAELVEQYGFHAFDLAHPDSPEFFWDRWPSGGFTFFSFSNANALGQIGNRAGRIKLAQPGFEGVRELVSRKREGGANEEAA